MAAGTLVQGALFTVMVVRAGMLRDPEFGRELAVQVERSPRFFRNAPVVLDLRGASGTVLDDLSLAFQFPVTEQKLAGAQTPL